jgi:hypothetical protein
VPEADIAGARILRDRFVRILSKSCRRPAELKINGSRSIDQGSGTSAAGKFLMSPGSAT